LRHILELHPAFVKLDRSLVTGLESDEARQAMIVGLCHFALATRCRLIAEGIETENELTALKLFKVELGQATCSVDPFRSVTPALPARDGDARSG